MAKVDFSAPLDTSGEIKENEQPTAAVAVVEPQTVTVATGVADSVAGEFEGEFQREDIAAKWLNLVPKSADTGTPGNFVLDREYDLGRELVVIFRHCKKFYVEDIDDAQVRAQVIPRRYDSVKAARIDGLFLNGTKGSNKIVPAAYLSLFVRLPEDHPSADFIADGHGWASARMKVKKGGFRAIVPVIARDRTGWLNRGLMTGQYDLSASLEKYQTFSWWQPTIKAAGKTAPKVLETLQAGFNFFDDVDEDLGEDYGE